VSSRSLQHPFMSELSLHAGCAVLNSAEVITNFSRPCRHIALESKQQLKSGHCARARLTKYFTDAGSINHEWPGGDKPSRQLQAPVIAIRSFKGGSAVPAHAHGEVMTRHMVHGHTCVGVKIT